MEAGRELDALVAEKVMGWRWLDLNHDINKGPIVKTPGWYGQGQSAVRTEFHPSTSIADAWEVVARLAETGYGFDVLIRPPQYDLVKDKKTQIAYVVEASKHGSRLLGMAGGSAPHVICIAALKTVGAL